MVLAFPKRPLLALGVAAVMSFLMPSALLAQQPEKQKEDQVETLKVNVNVVNLFFNVKDKRGALVPDLGKDQFEIFEDGKPQTIKFFSAESNQPLTLDRKSTR